MSASRANAAAKNRRAGGADISSQQQSRPGQQQQQPQQQPKLSVSDAIGLITLRLGRVENIVQQIQTEAPVESVKQEADPTISSRFIDITAFNSLIKRLDSIEQKQKSVPVPAPVPVPVPVPVPIAPTANLVTTDTLQSLEKELKEKIDEVKDLVLKLQSFTMDVNGKLVSILTEEPRGGGGSGMDMDMAKMFGGQFDLQSMLRAMQEQQPDEDETDQDQSENVIELAGPNIAELLTQENQPPFELENVEELN